MKLSEIEFSNIKLGKNVVSPYGNGKIFELFTMDGQNMISIYMESTKIIRINHKLAYIYEIL